VDSKLVNAHIPITQFLLTNWQDGDLDEDNDDGDLLDSDDDMDDDDGSDNGDDEGDFEDVLEYFDRSSSDGNSRSLDSVRVRLVFSPPLD